MTASESQEQGVPFPSDEAGPVDQWSLEVYEALSDWPVRSGGAWSRWEPGYLLLEITRVAGEPVDPILLYTSDEELTVCFGFWDAHLPDRGLTSADAAAEAVELVGRWLDGDMRTLVFRDEAGKWCGTIPVAPGDLNPQIAHSRDWLARFDPCSAELRTARLAEWRIIPFANGQLAE